MEVPDSGSEERHRFPAEPNEHPQRIHSLCRRQLRFRMRAVERTPEAEARPSGIHEGTTGRAAKTSRRNAGCRPQTRLWKLRLRSVKTKRLPEEEGESVHRFQHPFGEPCASCVFAFPKAALPCEISLWLLSFALRPFIRLASTPRPRSARELVSSSTRALASPQKKPTAATTAFLAPTCMDWMTARP